MRHSPSSKVLNKYVNYLALDRNQPKRKIEAGKITQMSTELQIMKDREKRHINELNKLKQDMDSLKSGKGILRLLMSLQSEKNINFSKLLDIEGFDKEFQEII